MNDIQWNVFDVKTTNNLNDMHLPVVTMNLNYNDNVENQSKSISFSMNPEQFAVLFAGKVSTYDQMKSSIFCFHIFFYLDLQAARDLIKTYSKF